MHNNKIFKLISIFSIFIAIFYIYSSLCIMYGVMKERKDKVCAEPKQLLNYENTLKMASTICIDAGLEKNKEFEKISDSLSKCKNEVKQLKVKQLKVFYADVTGYNTVPEQTDSDPCNAKGGNICGRINVVACPRSIPLFSWVKILDKKYQCMDWTSEKYNGRFDISFDKDIEAAKSFGKQRLLVELINEIK